MTTETVFGQMLALRLGNGDQHCPLESDTTGLNVKGKLYLFLFLYKYPHTAGVNEGPVPLGQTTRVSTAATGPAVPSNRSGAPGRLATPGKKRENESPYKAD